MTKEIRYQDKPWLANYEEGVPEKIEYENICLPAMLERSAAEYPENTALLFEGYKVSYRKLNDLANRFSAFLNELFLTVFPRTAASISEMFLTTSVLGSLW